MCIESKTICLKSVEVCKQSTHKIQIQKDIERVDMVLLIPTETLLCDYTVGALSIDFADGDDLENI